MTSLGGIVHYWLDDMPLAAGLWGIAALPATLWVLWDIVSGLRKGNVGVDLIAALALVGALLLGGVPGRGHYFADVCRRTGA